MYVCIIDHGCIAHKWINCKPLQQVTLVPSQIYIRDVYRGGTQGFPPPPPELVKPCTNLIYISPDPF